MRRKMRTSTKRQPAPRVELTPQQITAYDEQGLLFLPGLLGPDEMQRIKEELPPLLAEDSPARILERDGQTVRSLFGSHLKSELLARMVRLPRLLTPAKQLLRGEVYVYQFKVN